jgi:hypothetical protein
MSSPEAPYKQPASSQEQAFLQALIHELPRRSVLGNPVAGIEASRKLRWWRKHAARSEALPARW